MFSDKTTTGAYGAKDIKGEINSRDIDRARAALVRLKWLMGVRMYMRHKNIKAIFKTQKERIGTVLDALDTSLESNPQPGLAAWKKQGLKAYWNSYMDEKFKTANTRCENDMTTYLTLMNTKWGKKKVGATVTPALKTFQEEVSLIKAAWAKEKTKPWTAPW
jgi:hypothetical protein